MKRIDADGATGAYEFTDGNPSTGVAATAVDASWANTLQRELVDSLVERHGVTPDQSGADTDQILEVLLKLKTPGAYNLGLLYSSNQLKITAADHSALSSTNCGYVVMRGTTPGQIVALTVSSATHLFEDASGSSDIIGEQFGTTSGVAWGNARPYALYAVNSDDTASGLRFAISPNPTLTTVPLAAHISYHGNPMSTPSDSGMFFLTATDPTSSHAGAPCLLIGGVRLKKDASDDWTVVALGDSDGINNFANFQATGEGFIFPQQQMGAAANSHLQSTGNQVPAWATPANLLYRYTIDLAGFCRINYNTLTAGNCTSHGSASTDSLYLSSPYVPNQDFYNAHSLRQCGYSVVNNVTEILYLGLQDSTTSKLKLLRHATNTVAIIQENQLGANTNDDLVIEHYSFKAF